MFDIKTSSRAERTSLLYSLLLSVAILATGLIWSYKIGYGNLIVRHELGHAEDFRDALRKAHAAKQEPHK
jgi:hypothetical protein